MANHKSALKRARQSEVRQARNSINKTMVKHALKKARTTIGGEPAASAEALKVAMSTLQRAASKGTIHPRNVSRRISRLSRQIYQGQVAQAAPQV